jgi:hypothetical protein
VIKDQQQIKDDDEELGTSETLLAPLVGWWNDLCSGEQMPPARDHYAMQMQRKE